MIVFRNFALGHGARRLFSGMSLTLERGWKVGLVGANGSGKTTLLASIAGEFEADAGACEVQPGTRIVRIEQEAPALEKHVIEYVLDADDALRAAEREIIAADASADGERLAHAHERYAAADGYTAQARASAIVAGLGFAAADMPREVREFSGGYRMRLNLARALLRPSDLLLLDEPTNHLDLDTILWLESWLRGYAGMLVVVSHDRDFLDRVTDHTLAIIPAESGGTVRLYSGNYSAYERLHAQELEQQASLAARQEREIRRIGSFVERFRAKATKARQVQSRLKQLERMARVATVYAAETFRFQFEDPERQPERIVELDGAAAGYGERTVIDSVTLSIQRGDRVAVIGANGAGKTTLVRLLAGEMRPGAGERREGRDIVIGYFAQHEVEHLRDDESPLAMLKRLYPADREQSLRDYLGRFGFSGERAERPIGPLSGGEKSRLALAALVRRRPNLLLLDEPTNHLDLEMRRALAFALQSYTGALVVVSHDRHLVSTCADRILVVTGGRVEEFDGDLEDYRQLRLRDERGRRESAARPTRRDDRRSEAAVRAAAKRRLAPLERRVAEAEARIEELTLDRERIRTALADPALYADGPHDSLIDLTRRSAALDAALREAEDDWLHASARLDAARQEV